MTDAMQPPQPENGRIPNESALEIRRLAHDLSNALEIVIQTSYLLGMSKLDESGTQWVKMLDSGVQKAVSINRELREYVRSHS
jgi:hypothetical protein